MAIYDTPDSPNAGEQESDNTGSLRVDLVSLYGKDDNGKPLLKPSFRQLDQVSSELDSELNKFLPDRRRVLTILSGLTADELTQLRQNHPLRHNGRTLLGNLDRNFSMSEMEQARSYLERTDAGPNQACTLRAKLIELAANPSSRQEIELDIASILAINSSSQLTDLRSNFQSKYGQSLDSVLAHPRLSNEGRVLISSLLKGNDRRTHDDLIGSAHVALTAGNDQMFQLVMAIATKRARQDVLGTSEPSGFATNFPSDTRLRLVEYAQTGHQGLESQLKDNTGSFRDNDQAIEWALKNATTEERDLFRTGWNMVHNPVERMTAYQQQGLDYYHRLSSAMESAAGKPLSMSATGMQLKRWEDLLLSGGNGGLVTRLSDHVGVRWFNSSEDAVVATVEQITKEEWQYFQDHPLEERRVKDILHCFNKSTADKAGVIFDRQMKAENYEDAIGSDRTVSEILSAASGDTARVLSAIENMSPQEQLRYREDAGYRQELDSKLSSHSRPEQLAVRGMLTRIQEGKLPIRGLQETAHIIASTGPCFADGSIRRPSQIVREIQSACQTDPQTLVWIQQDPQRLKNFIDSLIPALTVPHDAYLEARTILEELISSPTGRLALPRQLAYDLSYADKKGFMHDLEHAAPNDLAALRDSHDLKNKLFSSLTPKEQQLANSILEQGEMRTEDSLRTYVLLKHSEPPAYSMTDKSTPKVVSLINNFPIQAQNELDTRFRYRHKFNSDLVLDLERAMPEKDFGQVGRNVLPLQLTQSEVLDRALLDSDRRRGFGRTLVGYMDGTGHQSDDAYNRLLTALVNPNGDQPWSSLSDSNKKVSYTRLGEALDNLTDSKKFVTDAAINAVLTAAVIGTSIVNGGVSLGLLARVTAFGGMFNVIARDAIMGADRKPSCSQLLTETVNGSATVLAMYFGPGEFARLLQLGETAGMMAASASIKQIASRTSLLSSEGATVLIRSGEKELESKMVELVRGAIVKGSLEIDRGAIKQLASQLAIEGNQQAVAELESILTNSLVKSIESQCHSELRRTATAYALTCGSGTVATMGTTALSGVLNGDSIPQTFSNALNAGWQSSLLTGSIYSPVRRTMRFTDTKFALPLAAHDIAGAASGQTSVMLSGSTANVNNDVTVSDAEQ